jgi:hypothetical protein
MDKTSTVAERKMADQRGVRVLERIMLWFGSD